MGISLISASSISLNPSSILVKMSRMLVENKVMTDHKKLKPILIASAQNNRLEFSSDVFKDILSKVGSRPVSVVSIIHPNGEQKGQMFNKCLKYLKTLDVNNNTENPYVWKSKTDADAKGIYLWPEPTIIRKSCDEVAVLLMEVNGYFTPSTATREDLMLFAVNCVISSTLIYSFENSFSDVIQEFLQLFGKYGKGGIGSELTDSFLNLVLMINNWQSTKRYPFGYHDSSTCPMKSLFNYRKEILDSDLIENKRLNEKTAFKNQHFVDSFHKIGFCLMPGIDSNEFDQNSNILSFDNVWEHIIIRLFHPSNLSLKYMSHQKFNGHQLIRLFEQMGELVDKSYIQIETPEEFRHRIRDVRALSVGLNYYSSKMNKEIEDKDYLKDVSLNRIHSESKKNALYLFEKQREVMASEGETVKDRFYDLFENEIQKVWEMYEELNQYKLKILNVDRVPRDVVIEMVEQVVRKKKEFNMRKTSLDIEVSKLIGFSLDELTNVVRSTLLTN